MENKILELNKINLTPNIENNIVELDDNFSFKKSLGKIKEKGIQRLRNMKYFSLNKYISFFIASILFSIILMPLITIGIHDFYINYFKTDIFFDEYMVHDHRNRDLLIDFFQISISSLILSIPLFYCNKYRKIYKKLNKFLSSEKVNNYFNKHLPFSSDKLNIITQNNSLLKEYILSNKNHCFNLHQINKLLDKENESDEVYDISKKLEPYIKTPNDFINDILEKDFSELEKFKILKIIKDEQSNLSNKKDLIMKKYKVIYSIENGPTKEIVIKNSFQDVDFFKEYINDIVLDKYARKFEIISINEI